MLNVYTQLASFTTAPVALSFTDVNGNPITRAQRLIIEPASTNTHDCFVEAAGVATGATGATAGVIRVLAKPPAANSGTITDMFEMATQHEHGIDTNAFQVDGTSGEKCRITIFA
jgi:hypothetical protein